MQLTAEIVPPDEPCLETAPAPRFAAPSPFVDKDNEGRLIPSLREAARTADPSDNLTRAAVLMYGVFLYISQNPREQNYEPPEFYLAQALADLSVTGRMAYTNLQATPMSDASLAAHASARLLAEQGVRADPAIMAQAVGVVLDRVYAVAWALRGPAGGSVAARAALGWIAVSGEDDKPHRPVNEAPPPFEQFEIPVTAHNVTVQTRFFIASAGEAADAPRAAFDSRALPRDPTPVIPDGHRVILFLHGHSSGAEEALEIVPHILQAGLDRGVTYSVVSLDLPNNGYSEPFDHLAVAPSGGTAFPVAPTDHGPILTPILDYIEDFVVAFVEALHRITPVTNRFAGVIGGSLGGNLGLRLGRRALGPNPWLDAAIVSWSPASAWTPMVQDVTKIWAPLQCRYKWSQAESDHSRADYFSEVYDQPVVPVIVPRTQPELWYRDGWQPCKTFHIAASRLARQEIYNWMYRRWHWRVAGEQLIYSHVDHVNHEDATTPLRCQLNTVPQLLAAGHLDNFTGSNIFDATRTLAPLMANTPGRTLFLADTGHSIHAERPRFLAGEIARFFSETSVRGPDLSFLAPLLFPDPAPAAPANPDISFLTPLLLSEPT